LQRAECFNSHQFNNFEDLRKKSWPVIEPGIAVAVSQCIAGICETQEWRWSVKFQKTIRVQMALLGLGAALVLGSPVRAQQDMDPTYFEINPGVSQDQRASATQTAQSLAGVGAPRVEAAAPVEMQKDGDAAQIADTAQLTQVDSVTMLVLIACSGFIVLYGVTETRRERQRKISPASASFVPSTPATAH